MMELINIKNIYKSYGVNDSKVEALKGVSLKINKGELVAIIGASGSGKSTLLNIIGCIDKPSVGEYFLLGEDINKSSERELSKIRNTKIGFVLQYFGLVSSYTVYENIELPLIYSKAKNKKEKINNILEKLKISDKKEKLPSELSGGQNQRVAIGRALINNPEIILADEPTGALDKKTSNQVMDLLKGLNEEGKTVIIVTHDDNVANRCDRIIKIEDGIIKGEKINEKKE